MTTLNTNTQFYKDLTDESKSLNMNGNVVSLGYWNLIVSIRDCKLYSVGIKPNYRWKISDVKTYFGLKGDVIKIKQQLEDIKSALTNS